MCKSKGVGVFENYTHLHILFTMLFKNILFYLILFHRILFHSTSFFLQGSVQLDDGHYSEPVLHLIAYKKWQTLTVPDRQEWAKLLGLRFVCMRDFDLSVDDLFSRVNRFLGGDEGEKRSCDSSQNIDKEKFLDGSSLKLSHIITELELNYFRLIITWASKDNIIRQEGNGKTDEKVTFKMGEIPMTDMKNLFPVYKKVSIIDDKKLQHGDYNILFKLSYESKYAHVICILSYLYVSSVL